LMEEREGEEKTTRGQGHGGTYDRERERGVCSSRATFAFAGCVYLR
jgi:hypothetical protein